MHTLAEKLHKLIELDKDCNIFGASSHKYQLNPTLSASELAAYEKRWNLQLPADYRRYLATVANGGAGPFYGLLALTDDDGATINLTAEFPYTGDNPLIIETLYVELEPQIADMDEDTAYEFSEAILSKVYESVDRGITLLAHEGCGIYSALVLKGTEYGNIWLLDLANDYGAFPLTSPSAGGSIKFAEWLAIWLDRSLAQLEQGQAKFMGYREYIK